MFAVALSAWTLVLILYLPSDAHGLKTGPQKGKKKKSIFNTLEMVRNKCYILSSGAYYTSKDCVSGSNYDESCLVTY